MFSPDVEILTSFSDNLCLWEQALKVKNKAMISKYSINCLNLAYRLYWCFGDKYLFSYFNTYYVITNNQRLNP